ncbi:pentapeptide repeat-containing protein [Lyngbya aestuarii]|uniref:pentapeptide repeat-containing protein n=1 Tax=Lyngbya aestuarii TaxID=118322 RepID=UPI00403E2803
MANMEQLLILFRLGVHAWNRWRTTNREVRPDFAGANLSKADLSEVDLSMVELREAKLVETELRNADLIWADLSDADLSDADLEMAKLNEANLSRANLSGANLSGAMLIGANLSGANLTGANFTGANLIGANLREAELIGANFSEAELSEVNLEKTHAFNANFHKAILTGVCLADWRTNYTTNLQGVICGYVYLQEGQQKRLPSSGFFASGEFTMQFQKAFTTIDLVFPEGVNWIALAYCLKTETENEDLHLQIKTIHEVEDNAILVRLKTPPEFDPAKTESALKEKYEFFCQVLQEKQAAPNGVTKGQNIAPEKVRAFNRQGITALTTLISQLSSEQVSSWQNIMETAAETRTINPSNSYSYRD